MVRLVKVRFRDCVEQGFIVFVTIDNSATCTSSNYTKLFYTVVGSSLYVFIWMSGSTWYCESHLVY